MRKEVETSEKIWGYVPGEGELQNDGQEPQGPRERAQKQFWISVFRKKYRKVCVARSRWCRRVDWYIWLRNDGKMELRVVRHLELEWCSVDRVVCVCVGLVTSEKWRNASGGNMEESYSSREPRERAQKVFENFFCWKEYMRCVMRILTWWVGAAVEFGILSCAMLVKSSSRMLLGLCHFEKWVYRCRTVW